MKKTTSSIMRKRIRKKKVIKETKTISDDMKQMVAYPIADLTLNAKIYEMTQMFLAQKQIKKGKQFLL